MRNDLILDSARKQGVTRIWIDGRPVGTAFLIGARLALTCHHCVRTAGTPVELRGHAPDGKAWLALVDDIVFPPNPLTTDAAVLRFNEDAPRFLPISATCPNRLGDLLAYGYPGSNPTQVIVRIDLQLRGETSFSYSDYNLPETFAVAGDPAAPGMSGGPVFDVQAGVVVAMIVGGPDYDNRAIALPLWAIENVGSRWNVFNFAARTNRQNSVHLGWAMNHQRAKQLCHEQVEDAISRLTRQRRYDPKRIVRRDRFMAEVAHFLISDRSTLIVTSIPNAGKTSAMAAAAFELAERSMFIEAFQVDHMHSSLATYLQRRVGELEQSQDGETIQLIASSLKTAGKMLVIFVDGVNEIKDGIGKAEQWITEAINEVGLLQSKLVISCRSDFWSALDIPRDPVKVYDLGFFSSAEVESAVELYKIKNAIPSELGRHPLMFRILSDPEVAQSVNAQGKFAAIQGFVQRLIKLSPGVRSPKLDFDACLRLLKDIALDEEMIPWELAANHLGGSGKLEGLIDGGVFRSRGRDAVRFTFDEMTEALRPRLPCDPVSLLDNWTRAMTDARVATRVVSAVVKAAFEGESELVSKHAEAFALAFSDFRKSPASGWKLADGHGLDALVIIVNTLSFDMPAPFVDQAQGVIKDFLDAIVNQVASAGMTYFTGRGLASFIMELGISTKQKFTVLTELLALCDDGNLRDKDLFDRGGISKLMRDADGLLSVAGALLKLAQDRPKEFLYLALPKLDDARKLQGRGEAKVGEVLTSILRISALSAFGDLFSGLLDASNSNNARRLLWNISADHPTRALDCAIAALSTSRAIAVMDQAIEPLLRSLGAGRGPVVLLERLRTIMREGTPKTRERVATLIRIVEPDDLEAWDELAKIVLSGAGTSRLYPVPAARARDFINLLRSRSNSFAIDQMYYYYGDARVEFRNGGSRDGTFRKRAIPS